MNTGIVYGMYDPREPGLIRYVGKTERPWNLRRNDHLHSARRGGEWPVCCWIRNLLGAGVEPEMVVLEDGVPAELLDDAEIRTIAEFRARVGRRLLNVSDGGDGAAGTTRSEETRRKLAESKIGERNPMHGRSGPDSPTWGRKHTEEAKEKIAAKTRERLQEWNPMDDPASREKLSETQTAYWAEVKAGERHRPGYNDHLFPEAEA